MHSIFVSKDLQFPSKTTQDDFKDTIFWARSVTYHDRLECYERRLVVVLTRCCCLWRSAILQLELQRLRRKRLLMKVGDIISAAHAHKTYHDDESAAPRQSRQPRLPAANNDVRRLGTEHWSGEWGSRVGNEFSFYKKECLWHVTSRETTR